MSGRAGFELALALSELCSTAFRTPVGNVDLDATTRPRVFVSDVPACGPSFVAEPSEQAATPERRKDGVRGYEGDDTKVGDEKAYEAINSNIDDHARR